MSIRLMVSGSRAVSDHVFVWRTLDHVRELVGGDVVLVHGACPRGADAIADAWAKARGVPVERHPANWDAHGKSAGFRRNQAMVDTRPSLVVGFPHLTAASRGTQHAMTAARRAGIPVFVRPCG